jgi:MYXO-CTERM domain-containing protein
MYDNASLRKALTALDTEKVDSDGDGTPDTEELKAGRNPNLSDGTSGPGGEQPGGGNVLPDPSYGCSAAPGAPVGLLLGGLWLWRRRRRA